MKWRCLVYNGWKIVWMESPRDHDRANTLNWTLLRTLSGHYITCWRLPATSTTHPGRSLSWLAARPAMAEPFTCPVDPYGCPSPTCKPPSAHAALLLRSCSDANGTRKSEHMHLFCTVITQCFPKGPTIMEWFQHTSRPKVQPLSPSLIAPQGRWAAHLGNEAWGFQLKVVATQDSCSEIRKYAWTVPQYDFFKKKVEVVSGCIMMYGRHKFISV